MRATGSGGQRPERRPAAEIATRATMRAEWRRQRRCGGGNTTGAVVKCEVNMGAFVAAGGGGLVGATWVRPERGGGTSRWERRRSSRGRHRPPGVRRRPPQRRRAAVAVVHRCSMSKEKVAAVL
jgi:hypothetical protein